MRFGLAAAGGVGVRLGLHEPTSVRRVTDVRPRGRALLLAATTWLRRGWIRLAPRSFLRLCKPTDVELGLAGEELAARSLRRAGFVVLARRLRTRHAEIDLLVRDGTTLVAIEVKAGRVERVPRPHGARDAPNLLLRWRPGARADRTQLARVERAVRALARAGGDRVRVDVVEILVEPQGRRIHVLHERGRLPRGARDSREALVSERVGGGGLGAHAPDASSAAGSAKLDG